MSVAHAAAPADMRNGARLHARQRLTATCAPFIRQCASTGPLSTSSFSSLRALLGLTSLLARREYPKASSASAASAKGLSLPLEVFPGVVASLVLLMEAVERPVIGADDSASSHAHQVKFHSLHAYNRLLEGFPEVAGVFATTVLEQCGRELFPEASSSVLSPTYSSKLLETLGLLTTMFPRLALGSSHTLLEKTLRLVEKQLEGVEEWAKEEPEEEEEEEEEESASASSSKPSKPVKLPTQLSPAHSFTLSLLDFSSTLLRRLHFRFPVSYPSSRLLQPRAWPFGTEELGEEKDEDGEEEGEKDEEEEDQQETIDEEEEDEEESGNSSSDASSKFVPQPRQCFTEALHPNPAKRGAQLMALTPQQASELFGSLLSKLAVFYHKIGVEAGSSRAAAGTINEHGSTILSFLPLVVALENLYCNADEASRAAHGQHVEFLSDSLLDSLRSLSFLSPSSHRFQPLLASAAHQLLQAMEGVWKHADRRAGVEAVPTVYNDLVNWLADAQAAFPRQAFIKLRRYAVSAFLALMYTMDSTFQDAVGTQAFFSELFPLLANPLLTSHLVWLLRSHPEHLSKKVLPQILRGLLNTKTKQSPSMKTVVLILTSLGNVACFVRALGQTTGPAAAGEDSTSSSSKPLAVLPVLAPYMEQLLETIIGTMEKSPSGTGQVACLVLCRIVLCGYDMPEVRSSLPRILTLYRRVLDESLFVAEQAEMGEEYDEDDQDLVSQLQYCALDMLHVFFQDQAEAALDPVARGKTDDAHPFVQEKFLKVVAEDEDCVQVLREIVQVLIENTKKPSQSHNRAEILKFFLIFRG
jgi:hypothetical protein